MVSAAKTSLWILFCEMYFNRGSSTRNALGSILSSKSSWYRKWSMKDSNFIGNGFGNENLSSPSGIELQEDEEELTFLLSSVHKPAVSDIYISHPHLGSLHLCSNF